MTTPRISVVIPVHNGAAYLREALESVAWQTLAPAEVIVVDDGSTDCSSAVVAAFPGVRCLSQENLGVAAARNAGLAAATGDTIAFLDADDIWLPDRLERQAALLPAVMVIGRQCAFLSGGLTATPHWYRYGPLDEAVLCYEPSSWLVPAATFKRYGVFDPAYRRGEDWEWLSRLPDRAANVAICDEVVVLRRLHATNLSHDSVDAKAAVLRFLRGSAARQRRAATEPEHA